MKTASLPEPTLPRVLIVDDDANAVRHLGKILNGLAESTYASSGEEALQRTREHLPDLVLLDAEMPGLDGFETCTRMRALPGCGNLPILFVTVHSDPESEVRALELGAVDFIHKPFSPAVVQARVKTHLMLKRHSDELRHLNRALEAACRDLDSFAHTVAHDLRAPLRAIGGYSHALLEDCGDGLNEDGKGYLAAIIAQVGGMDALIEGLLQMSRGTRRELVSGPIDLSEMARRISEDLQQEDPERSVDWQIEEGMTALGDAVTVGLVLQNLLGNAWKYTARTTRPVIRVYAEQQGPTVWFHVADNGVGFDMKHAAKLFQPFQRLHHQQEFPGIGIGLATVQRIVQRHGGEVRAESTPGTGATFSFTLTDGR